jgi:hypothetical protein
MKYQLMQGGRCRHRVQLITNFVHQHVDDLMKWIQQRVDWCKQKLQPFSWYWYPVQYCLYFEHEQDAVLFMITWQ